MLIAQLPENFLGLFSLDQFQSQTLVGFGE
jgi:hypothetical protein